MSFNVLSGASLFWKLAEMGYLENMDIERRTVQIDLQEIGVTNLNWARVA